MSGDINLPIIDGSTIDGVTLDFNTSHYVKMNIIGREITNFDQFNALEVNNQPPQDFEFNAILWFYTVEDLNGNHWDGRAGHVIKLDSLGNVLGGFNSKLYADEQIDELAPGDSTRIELQLDMLRPFSYDLPFIKRLTVFDYVIILN